MIVGFYLITLICVVWFFMIVPLKKEQQYRNLNKHKENKTVFTYKRDNSGIYSVIQNVEKNNNDILLTLEITYPDKSTEIFKTYLEVFNDTWE